MAIGAVALKEKKQLAAVDALSKALSLDPKLQADSQPALSTASADTLQP